MNLANNLTKSRIGLSFLILIVLLFPWADAGITFPSMVVSGKVIVNLKYIIAGFLFVIASVTDYLDGAVARRGKMTSDYGATLDAIADKVLVNGVLVALAYLGFISIVIPILIIIRDTMMDALRIMAAKKGTIIKANVWGKLKTVCMLTGISFLLFYNLPFEIWGIYVAEILIYVATVLSIVSFVVYYLEWKRKVKIN